MRKQQTSTIRQQWLRLMICLVWLGVSCEYAAAVEPVIVLRGADLIDGTGKELQKNCDLVIHAGKIIAVRPAETTTPEGAKVINLQGKTIIPGLISGHAHVGQFDGISRAPSSYNEKNILRQLRQYEAYGVTTVVALGTNQLPFYAIRELTNSGSVPGADLFGADRGIGVRGGVPSGQVLPASADIVDRPQNENEARAAVREAKDRGTDFIKMWVDDARGTAPKMTSEVYTAVIDEAHKNDILVTAHIFNLTDAKALVAAGIDVIAHGVRDQPVDRELVSAMKEKGVWYIPTLALDDATFVYADREEWFHQPFFQNSLQPELKKQLEDDEWRDQTLARPNLKLSREALNMNLRNLAVLHEAGVKIGFGTDSGAMPLRIPGFAEHREIHLMSRAGLEPLEIITIATGKTAELLRLQDRGTLEAGKRADFVVLDKNPLDDISHVQLIHSVWQRGKQSSGSVLKFRP